MEWTCRYFLYRSHRWKLVGDDWLPGDGRNAYAARQQSMWLDMLAAAQKKFSLANPTFVIVCDDAI